MPRPSRESVQSYRIPPYEAFQTGAGHAPQLPEQLPGIGDYLDDTSRERRSDAPIAKRPSANVGAYQRRDALARGRRIIFSGRSTPTIRN
jgi:hypothetical protein